MFASLSSYLCYKFSLSYVRQICFLDSIEIIEDLYERLGQYEPTGEHKKEREQQGGLIIHDKTKELIYSIGVPKLYIILDLKWDEFKERIFKRGRDSEIDNFSVNEPYFRSLHNVYVDYLVKTCQIYGINYLILDYR